MLFYKITFYNFSNKKPPVARTVVKLNKHIKSNKGTILIFLFHNKNIISYLDITHGLLDIDIIEIHSS